MTEKHKKEIFELKIDKDKSAYWRGLLIQETIDLELRMEIVIGRFLSMNNQERVLDLLEIFDISKIDFSSKMAILIYIVKKHFPEFKQENSEFTDYRKNFFEFMEYVMIKRNVLAHKKPDFNSQEYLKLNWTKTAKNSIQKANLNLDIEFISEFNMKLNNCYIILIELEQKIINWSESSLNGKET
jgi:hypothetical protein